MTDSIMVAGRHLSDPLAALLEYVSRRPRTVTEFDLGPMGSPLHLTKADVECTRILSSRISKPEAEWFVDIGSSAPWASVSNKKTIYSMDPSTAPGRRVLREAHKLYVHFWDHKPRGVGSGKIHKVLHVKRPFVIPILDSVVWRAYSDGAAEVTLRYPDAVEGSTVRARWLAIRDDLVRQKGEFADLRKRLLRREEWRGVAGSQGHDRLSNLRLLDVLVWSSR